MTFLDKGRGHFIVLQGLKYGCTVRDNFMFESLTYLAVTACIALVTIHFAWKNVFTLWL